MTDLGGTPPEVDDEPVQGAPETPIENGGWR